MHKSGLWVRPSSMDAYVIKEQSSYNKLPIDEQSIVLDIGGHIGAFARRAIDRGASMVYSYEPEPDNFRILEVNAQGFNIKAFRMAIVSSDEEFVPLWLNSGKNTGNHSLIERRGRGGVQVPAFNFKKALQLHTPSVMKIDIEGGEYQLIDDLLNLPSFVKAVAMEIHFIRDYHFEQGQRIANIMQEQFEVLRAPRFGATLWYTLGIWAR